MKETKTIAKAANFTAVDFGKMSEIKDYTLQLGPEIKIPGKVFGGQNVNATGGGVPLVFLRSSLDLRG